MPTFNVTLFCRAHAAQAVPLPIRRAARNSDGAAPSPLAVIAEHETMVGNDRGCDRARRPCMRPDAGGDQLGVVAESTTAGPPYPTHQLAWIPSGITEKAARADRGRLVRSAIGDVQRDLEAKAQVNRSRGHPCHSRSPVIAGSTAGPRVSMSTGSRRCNRASRWCASFARL